MRTLSSAARRLFLLVALVPGLLAQTPGTVDVTLKVTARAGVLTCTVTPSGSTYTMACSTATWTLPPIPVTPEPGSTGAVTLQVNKGADAVTMIVSQPVANGPVSWEVAANGVRKAGTF